MPITGPLGPPTPLHSIREFTGTGAQINWEFSFDGGYLSQNNVKVAVIDLLGVKSYPAFTFAGYSTLTLSPPVPAGHKIFIYRDTPKATPTADFGDGAVISEKNLDDNSKQAIFAAAELRDRLDSELGVFDDERVSVPSGEGSLTLPTAAARANKVLGFGPTGLPVPVSGTGTDAALRDDLGDPDAGADIVAYRAPGAGAATRPAKDAIAEVIRVTDYQTALDADGDAACERAIAYHASLPVERRIGAKIILRGLTAPVSQVLLRPANNGVIIGYGKLVRKTGTSFGPNGVLSGIQRLVDIEPIENITVKNLVIEGSAQYTRDDTTDAADTLVNLDNFQNCNGIEFFSQQTVQALRGVRNITIQNVRVSRVGKSAVLIDEPENCSVHNVTATQCVGHTVGVSANSNYLTWVAGRKLSISISMVRGYNTMTLVDLSAITNYDQAVRFLAYANLSDFYGQDIRGRSKIAGVWGVNIDGFSVDNGAFATRLWAALELAAKGYSVFNISNVYARGMRGALMGQVYSQVCPVNASSVTAINCNFGVWITAEVLIMRGLTTENVYIPIKVSSLNKSVAVDGFHFKNVSRETFVTSPDDTLPEYGITSVPTKLFSLSNGVIEGVGSPTLAYGGDYFMYVPPSAVAADLIFNNIRVTGTNAQRMRTFVRNDCPVVSLHFDKVRVDGDVFSHETVRNNEATADLFVTNSTLPSIVDEFGGRLTKLGNSYMWSDASNILRIKATRPTTITDGTAVGSQ